MQNMSWILDRCYHGYGMFTYVLQKLFSEASGREAYLSDMPNCHTSVTPASVHQLWQNHAGYSLQISSWSSRKYESFLYSHSPLCKRRISFPMLIGYYFLSDEIKREREFYRARGLACPKDILPNAGEIEEERSNADTHAESDYHRTDEQVITTSECLQKLNSWLKLELIW